MHVVLAIAEKIMLGVSNNVRLKHRGLQDEWCDSFDQGFWCCESMLYNRFLEILPALELLTQSLTSDGAMKKWERKKKLRSLLTPCNLLECTFLFEIKENISFVSCFDFLV